MKSRKALLPLLLLLAALAALSLRPRAPKASPAPAARTGAGKNASAEETPLIDLARLLSPPPESRAGRRDVFEYGMAQPDPDELPKAAPTSPPATPIPVTTPALPLRPAAPRLAAINLKYVGSLEARDGPKVAVLLTDHNEVLYGQVGESLANRYKIVRIGYESIELLDESSGQSRRIPYKSN